MELFIIAAEKYDSSVTDTAFRKRLPPSANTSTTTGVMTCDFWVETVTLLRSAEGGWQAADTEDLPLFPVSHSKANCFLTTNFLNCDQVVISQIMKLCPSISWVYIKALLLQSLWHPCILDMLSAFQVNVSLTFQHMLMFKYLHSPAQCPCKRLPQKYWMLSSSCLLNHFVTQ